VVNQRITIFYQSQTDKNRQKMPLVNRRRDDSKQIIVPGRVAGSGRRCCVDCGGGRSKDKGAAKKATADKICRSWLCPLPAQPIPFVAVTPAQPPPIATKLPTPATPASTAKQPLDWKDRKMIGGVLISEQGGKNAVAVLAEREDDKDGGGSSGERSELAAKLEPTITKGTAASLLPYSNSIIAKGTALDRALETALNKMVPDPDPLQPDERRLFLHTFPNRVLNLVLDVGPSCQHVEFVWRLWQR
jgi:type IV secretion system protein VirB10